jgi:hypothetical protein
MLSHVFPDEIREFILEFIQPYLTREDWRTCRKQESDKMNHLIYLYHGGKPRNNSYPVPYSKWSFYEKLRFGVLETTRPNRPYLKFGF